MKDPDLKLVVDGLWFITGHAAKASSLWLGRKHRTFAPRTSTTGFDKD